MGPVYLRELLVHHKPKHNGLRHDPLSMKVAGTARVTYGDRTFRALAGKAWHKLPRKIRAAKAVDHFKAELKTYLFEL